MLPRLTEILKTRCALLPDRPVLAGVSGGADSICLLHLLHEAGCPLIVAHLDHQLRPESAADAAFVAGVAEDLHLPLIIRQVDVATLAAETSASIEEAARLARYAFLFQAAREHGAQAVAVAHNADDQVETVLMHFLRGSGLSGLAGMPFRSLPNPWSEVIPLVRPLLSTWRAEIEGYNQSRGLPHREDLSNRDPRFTRNRLRNETIPALEAIYPQLRQVLWRNAAALSADRDLLDQLAAAAWETLVLSEGPGYACLDAIGLLAQPAAIQQRLVRLAASRLRPDLRNFDYAAVMRALAFLEHPSRTRHADLAAGLRLEMNGDMLCIAAWEADLPGASLPQLPPGEEFRLNFPGAVSLPEGWQLRAGEILPASQVPVEAWNNDDPYQAWIDPDRLTGALTIRARLPGDRLCPLGMSGRSIKLTDLMINQKIPRRSRRHWPVLCDGDQVVWVPGLRLGEDFRLMQQSQHAVHLALERSQ